MSTASKRSSSLRTTRTIDRVAGFQLGVRVAHFGDDDVDQRDEKRPRQPQLAPVPHCPAHDLAENITAPLVRRDHAIGDEKRRRANVVGDDPHRHVGGRHRGGVNMAGHRAERRENRHEQLRVVVRQRPLHDRGDALQAHAGVDRWRGKRRQLAFSVPLELHEDVVPDLHESFAARLDIA